MTPDPENGSPAPSHTAEGRDAVERPPAHGEPARPLPAASAVLAGVASAALGLAPWLVTGMTLPLQNIWETDTLPEEMPLALLPLSQYYLVASVAMVVMGSAFAGALARLAASIGRPVRLWLVGAGAAAVQVVALVQTAAVLQGGLEDSTRALVYLLGMIAGVSVGIVVGLLVMTGLARAGTAGTTVAITFAALALAQWLPTLIQPIGAMPSYDTPQLVYDTVRWLPVLIVAVAVGWCGVMTVRRALASVVSLLALWIVPAVVVAFTYAVGSRIYLQDPSELIPAGTHVFRSALTSAGTPQHMLVAVVVAIMVGIVLVAARSMRDTPAPGAD
ncbi:hypothetical protein [Demequina muriae]|uniref:Uncharacterized protein n=1 Tax=Demequina muriae TaxID=3051664 RepID=A0ABT8GED5_9MICO|nr:hypothetical protein [Demequina sp. EGI L300058]MDN4479792.1 hypothetical protein [Demequina sp. EGI L300058]